MRNKRTATVFVLSFLLIWLLLFSGSAAAEVFDDPEMEEIGEEYIENNDMENRFHWLISEHLFHSAYEETEEEKKIRSYVQVPWSMYPDSRWTGPWNGIKAGGQRFSNFGCGVCCLTNLYTTILEESCTPWKMYTWCREYSSYRPSGKSGAIDWLQMEEVCQVLGLNTAMACKPADYGVFQEQMRHSRAMLVLVCKDNDDTLWWYTAGHYVTVWEYAEETDSVFVADPSGLYNRERVPLSLVYAALKTGSRYQYMMFEPDGSLME